MYNLMRKGFGSCLVFSQTFTPWNNLPPWTISDSILRSQKKMEKKLMGKTQTGPLLSEPTDLRTSNNNETYYSKYI